jgi:hypothetical protein
MAANLQPVIYLEKSSKDLSEDKLLKCKSKFSFHIAKGRILIPRVQESYMARWWSVDFKISNLLAMLHQGAMAPRDPKR